MAFADFLLSIENSGFGTAIREGSLYFPALECIHVIAMVTVAGSIAVIDLRLLGLASKDEPVSRLNNELLRWTWGAFVVSLITGLFLFSSTPTRYVANPFFIGKFVIMFLAGVNMLVFHYVTYRSVKDWDTSEVIPGPARLAGGLSILFWATVIVLGRWVGFV